ncbi:aldehyde dehydrogenase [Macrolepiota fuliginosa MF-IS2]|uniref:Aldehyde dehydrogenase n=1 Tax=Macrolepiota fuliginosa MF-IS2 TaxID=1400762 RepID=A0A9P5X716_9AGAR|nr:aldehyde dehydrogenase [Macrolepiota fuliginosa MF-IS2]
MPGTYTHELNTTTYKGSVTINTGLYINGQWVDPVGGGDKIEVVDPSTGKLICAIAGGSSKDVDVAVAAAQKAFKTSWGLKVPGSERGKLLYKLVDLMEKHRDQLAALEALNVGKGFYTARAVDVESAIKTFRYYAGWADKVHGKTIETTENKMAYTRHEPWGVVGAIVPWNFPLSTASSKLSPALATGNTVVLKPSEITPLSALLLADLINQAGFPPGVVNILNGYGSTVGAAIAEHPKIAKVSFTGSTITGRRILKAAAETNLKAVTLELGGKSPTIVFDDVDLEQAIKWASMGIFFNMGQVCVAGSRIYVQEGIYDKFLQGFSKTAEQLTKATGSPFEPTTQHGPQVSQTQFDRVMGYIESGKAAGAKVHLGGERHGDSGFFIKPTIFVNATPDMKIMQEEIFGPVCSIVKFKTEEGKPKVTEWANDTTYGLAANVLTQNTSRAIRMAHNLEAGTVSVNCALAGDINVPFGGYKQSGIGRENGEYALETYTQVKAVHINIGQKL